MITKSKMIKRKASLIKNIYNVNNRLKSLRGLLRHKIAEVNEIESELETRRS